MIIAGLWRYGDWRHVALGCSALVILIFHIVHYFCWLLSYWIFMVSDSGRLLLYLYQVKN